MKGCTDMTNDTKALDQLIDDAMAEEKSLALKADELALQSKQFAEYLAAKKHNDEKLEILWLMVKDYMVERERYESIEEFISEWEDYKPAEPLIKDEKIRKAVRAWAEANELEPDYEVKYDADMYGLNSWQTDINFNYRIDGLEHNEKYTIAELCGEEEE